MSYLVKITVDSAIANDVAPLVDEAFPGCSIDHLVELRESEQISAWEVTQAFFMITGGAPQTYMLVKHLIEFIRMKSAENPRVLPSTFHYRSQGPDGTVTEVELINASDTVQLAALERMTQTQQSR